MDLQLFEEWFYEQFVPALNVISHFTANFTEAEQIKFCARTAIK